MARISPKPPPWTLPCHARFVAEQVRTRYDLGVEDRDVLDALYRYSHTVALRGDGYDADALYAASVAAWNDLLRERPFQE